MKPIVGFRMRKWWTVSPPQPIPDRSKHVRKRHSFQGLFSFPCPKRSAKTGKTAERPRRCDRQEGSRRAGLLSCAQVQLGLCLPTSSLHWTIRSLHLNSSADRPLLRRRNRAKFVKGSWFHPDEHRVLQHWPSADLCTRAPAPDSRCPGRSGRKS